MNMDKHSVTQLVEKYFSRTISDLILINQIPAPTFEEKKRGEIIRSRFNEFELSNVRRDRAGNISATIPGSIGRDNILVFANLDGLFSEVADVLVKVEHNKVIGKGLGNNSIGLAGLLCLAEMVKKENITLRNNLVLVATASSIGDGNSRGMKRFLDRFKKSILFGICLEGRKLGRIDHWAFGSARFELKARAIGGDSWNDYPRRSAIDIIHRVADEFTKVPVPRNPKTIVNITKVEGSSAFGQINELAALRGEILSDGMEVIDGLIRDFENIVDNFVRNKGFDVSFEVISKRPTGGIPNYHYLVELAQSILEECGVKSRLGAIENDMGVLLTGQIPAVTLGLARTGLESSGEEFVHLDSLKTGLCQLLMMVKRGEDRADELGGMG